VIVRPASPETYGWIAARANLVPGPQFQAIEAVTEEGRILGMVGFDGWLPNAVSLHIAMEEPGEVTRADRRRAMHALIETAFRTAFNGCGRGIAIATVLSNNDRSRRLVERVGFRFAGKLEDAWEPGVDLLFYQMRRDECRWLEA
jgi:RimJ/RimL family protein N-acetyltransferase